MYVCMYATNGQTLQTTLSNLIISEKNNLTACAVTLKVDADNRSCRSACTADIRHQNQH